MPKLRSLHVYPLKGARGIAIDEAAVDEAGLEMDRRWMVVDPRGRFLSQRSHRTMALLRTELAAGGLRVTAPGRTALELPVAPPDGPRETFSVWDKDRDAVSCGPEAAAWMTDFLGTECRIVRSIEPDGVPRLGPRDTVRAGFADGWPAQLASVESLADLNARLLEPIPMNRFRPNLVVEGAEKPYAEDDWRRIRIGDVAVVWRKLDFRCAVTTADQETGERGVEPLRTLATYRRAADGEVFFGAYFGFASAGRLRVGDAVNVEARA